MLEQKLKKGLRMIGEYDGGGDDDSGLDIGGGGTGTPLDMEVPIDPESLNINLKVSIRRFPRIYLHKEIFDDSLVFPEFI